MAESLEDKEIYFVNNADPAAAITHHALRLPSTAPAIIVIFYCLAALQSRREIKNYDDRYFTMLLYLKLGNAYLRCHYIKAAQQAYQAALNIVKTESALTSLYESPECHYFDVARRFLKSAAWALSVGAYAEAEDLFQHVTEMDSNDEDFASAQQGLTDTLSAKKREKKPFSYLPSLKFPFYAQSPQPKEEKVDASKIVAQFSSLNLQR